MEVSGTVTILRHEITVGGRGFHNPEKERYFKRSGVVFVRETDPS
jgi:hypothetical protein